MKIPATLKLHEWIALIWKRFPSQHHSQIQKVLPSNSENGCEGAMPQKKLFHFKSSSRDDEDTEVENTGSIQTKFISWMGVGPASLSYCVIFCDFKCETILRPHMTIPSAFLKVIHSNRPKNIGERVSLGKGAGDGFPSGTPTWGLTGCVRIRSSTEKRQ